MRRCPSNPNGHHRPRRHRPIINSSRNRTYAPLLKGTRGLSSNINIIDNSIERDELANRDRAAASIHHLERVIDAGSRFLISILSSDDDEDDDGGAAVVVNFALALRPPISVRFTDWLLLYGLTLVTRRQAPRQDISTARRIYQRNEGTGNPEGGNNKKTISIHKQVTVVRTII